MKRILKISTRQFPYGKSETFLETEILYLSLAFDQIIIYPTTKDVSIRNVPENVLVNNLIADEYQKAFKWTTGSLFTSFFYTTLFKYRRLLSSLPKVRALMKYIVSFNIYNKKVKALTGANDNSLIYSYWYTAFVDAVIKSNPKANIITRAHGGDLYEERSPLGFFPYRKETINNIKKIFCISETGAQYLKERYLPDNIKISKLGVDNGYQSDLPLNENVLSVISVSNIIPLKRVGFIAESLIEYCLLYPKMSVIWNHFGDGVERRNVENILNTHTLPNLSVTMHGRVNNSLVFDFYKESPVDLFINLSESEGIPVSIMESMSFGVPAIATNVGGVSEIVNSENGILLHERPEKNDVVKALKDIKGKFRDRNKLRQYWNDNYAASTNYTHFANDLSTILSDENTSCN
jgi:glycosyltransferase involved in cell wall biosynthesis